MVCEAIHFVGYAIGAIATVYTLKLRKKVAKEQIKTEHKKQKLAASRTKTENVRRGKMWVDMGVNIVGLFTGGSKKKSDEPES